ncbi:histone-like nucleoid-structuring protein Lsr2 [Nocardia sp. NPDC003482]
MVKKVTVELIDDYDGKSPAIETVRFSVDGVTYELDLSASNIEELRAAFSPWIRAARKAGRVTNIARHARQTPTEPAPASTIREWARASGLDVGTRGRIRADIVAAHRRGQLGDDGHRSAASTCRFSNDEIGH